MKEFILKKKRIKKALIIFGGSGVGKTSSVHAIGKELGYEVFELNSSHFRNKDELQKTIGNASVQRSLLGMEKIILVDELEGLSGQKDRGAIASLIKIMQKSHFPVVITLEDPFEKKFSSLRTKCEIVKFNNLTQLTD